jgi:hypothetical protein
LPLSLTVTSAPITVTVVPPSSFSTSPGSMVQFQASVTGTSNTAVTWSLSSAIGSISSSGLYIAGSVTYEQNQYVVATSVVDPAVIGLYLLTLEPQITVSPGNAVLYPNQPTQQFGVTLIGLSSGVTWSISPAVGSIDAASGLYTAPSSITTRQVITVTATSHADPSKSGSATLTLSPVTVGIAGPQPVIVVPQTQQFFASVAGSTNQSVTWSLRAGDVGAISASGLYTPPATITNPATIHVTATSVGYPSASAQDVLTLVNPDSLQSFTLQPVPGQPGLWSGAVTTYLQTGSTGIQLTISSSAASATTLPPSILVPAFSVATTAFLVAVSPSAGNGPVTITAVGPSNSLSATVSLGVRISVSPQTTLAIANQTAQFAAKVTGASNTAVTWSLSPNVGSLSAAGLYTAPASVPARQFVNLLATSVADGTKITGGTVILEPVSVFLSPGSTTLYASQTQQFVAAVTGSNNSGVTWTINPQVGSISSAGLYTAPASITSTQSLTITATSNTDSSKAAVGTIFLAPPTAFTVSPAVTSLYDGQTQQFTSADSNVMWSLTPNVGTLSLSGFYTAPFGIGPPQIVTITATDNTNSTQLASVTVNLIPFLTIDVGPGGVPLSASQSQQFTAIVGNAANLGVTWSISPQLGSISATGLYTAPAYIPSATSVSIQATSIANPSRSAAVQVSLTPTQ